MLGQTAKQRGGLKMAEFRGNGAFGAKCRKYTPSGFIRAAYRAVPGKGMPLYYPWDVKPVQAKCQITIEQRRGQ